MNIAGIKEMREVEKLGNEMGASFYEMMTEAGRMTAEKILSLYDLKNKSVLVLCGKGNNGGDGFVIAGSLKKAGAYVKVYLAEGEPKTETAQKAFCENNISELLTDNIDEDFYCIIDAVYGIGFRGSLRENMKALIAKINAKKAVKLAVDVPSGAESDTGKYESCFKADVTFAIGEFKPLHMVKWKADFCGETILIKIPSLLKAGESVKLFKMLAEDDLHLPERLPWGHKGSNGRALLICGSLEYPGAALLAVGSALRVGTGYVTLAAPREICRMAVMKYPEIIVKPILSGDDEKSTAENVSVIEELLKSCDSVGIGSGMGRNENTKRLTECVIKNAFCPIILDADSLNVLSEDNSIIGGRDIAILPHMGEAKRLLGDSKSIYELAEEFAGERKITVLLKDAVSRIYTENEKLISYFGCDALSRAGSGDTLFGAVTGFAANTKNSFEAVKLGCCTVGKAGELSAKNNDSRTALPHELPKYYGEVFKNL